MYYLTNLSLKMITAVIATHKYLFLIRQRYCTTLW